MTLEGADEPTFMTKKVGDQPYIKSGCATDNSHAALIASLVERVIGIDQNSNNRAFLVVVISKKSIDRR